MQKLYVGNLPFDITTEEVTELFSKYGSVRDCYLPRDRATGSTRGFAFISLDGDVVDQAIKEMDGMEFKGRPLGVSLPMPAGEKPTRKQRKFGA